MKLPRLFGRPAVSSRVWVMLGEYVGLRPASAAFVGQLPDGVKPDDLMAVVVAQDITVPYPGDFADALEFFSTAPGSDEVQRWMKDDELRAYKFQQMAVLLTLVDLDDPLVDFLRRYALEVRALEPGASAPLGSKQDFSGPRHGGKASTLSLRVARTSSGMGVSLAEACALVGRNTDLSPGAVAYAFCQDLPALLRSGAVVLVFAPAFLDDDTDVA